MIKTTARKVLQTEAESILGLIDRIDDAFVRAVDAISRCKGKVVLTGIGKSGLVSKKIASTLASTGTPAFFLHPAEGIHGDVGMLSPKDIIIVLSNSGETEEILHIVPLLKRMGLQMIVITGNVNSTLASRADLIINTGVREEACPWNLVPTSSTTAAMAMGDALAIAVLVKRGFREEDFAILHPGGILGKRLLLRVEDIMHRGNEIPLVAENDSMKDTLIEMTSKRLGVTGVIDQKKNLIGVVTDGDLRRAIEKYNNVLTKQASQIMTTNPKQIRTDALAARALHLMQQHAITSLFVYNGTRRNRVVGIVHMHDLLKEGII